MSGFTHLILIITDFFLKCAIPPPFSHKTALNSWSFFINCRESHSSTGSTWVVTGRERVRSGRCWCRAACWTRIRATAWWWSNSSERPAAAAPGKTARSHWWTRPSWTRSAAINCDWIKRGVPSNRDPWLWLHARTQKI